MKIRKISAKIISCVLTIIVLGTVFSTTTVHAAEPGVPNMSVAGTKITEANKNDILGDGTCSLSYN
ncbi:MAG: hypothetical protein RR954_08175 [Christensenellaceae bacterium]